MRFSSQKGSAVLYLLLLALAACSSSEEPELPKPRASIYFDIQNLPFTIGYDWWYDRWYVDLTIVVYEKNGVGVNITVIKTGWFEGNTKVSESTHTGGYVPGNGSKKFNLYSYCPAKYKPTRFTIRIEGTDSNGNRISREKEYSITWPSGVVLETS